MPLEIMIDNRTKGVMKLFTFRRMDELEEAIDEIPELSKPISIVNLVIPSKRTYNGKPEYYDLPTSQSSPLSCPTQKMRQKFKGQRNESYVDSTGQFVESQHLCVMR
jgi:hypothetical protein